MDIKNSLLKGADPYKAALEAKEGVKGARASAAQAQHRAPTPAQTGDRVSLSPAAMLHTAARSAADQAPELRQEKVDGLKERVAAGNYAVDSKKVAEKLLQTEAFLAGTLGS